MFTLSQQQQQQNYLLSLFHCLRREPIPDSVSCNPFQDFLFPINTLHIFDGMETSVVSSRHLSFVSSVWGFLNFAVPNFRSVGVSDGRDRPSYGRQTNF